MIDQSSPKMSSFGLAVSLVMTANSNSFEIATASDVFAFPPLLVQMVIRFAMIYTRFVDDLPLLSVSRSLMLVIKAAFISRLFYVFNLAKLAFTISAAASRSRTVFFITAAD